MNENPYAPTDRITVSPGDGPRALRAPEAIAARRLMLAEPHIAPLAAYVEGLRAKYPDWEFQDFDPLDGGVDADLLFLLEKPGPMTSPTGKRKGSGFISRNNDDPTAQAVFEFMVEAGIARKRTVLWNVIPGWNATIKTTRLELRRGVEELAHLLALLPNVRTVILVGRQARSAQPLLEAMNLRVFTSAHPGGQVFRFNPDQWRAIPARWKEAGLVLEADNLTHPDRS
ncbi:uracil-DNA glycosylase [Paraburkholderia sp. SIMBA_054]|uniref:uracil-DNA glycosylase n=1 Tax=Paraburkholderia sp. SIMBA_054 TaxID=3085795 RepID=UPI00397B3436